MAATARRDGDAYVLEGEKAWITNAPIADLAVVFAKARAAAVQHAGAHAAGGRRGCGPWRGAGVRGEARPVLALLAGSAAALLCRHSNRCHAGTDTSSLLVVVAGLQGVRSTDTGACGTIVVLSGRNSRLTPWPHRRGAGGR